MNGPIRLLPNRAIIGMVHLAPLPGSPAAQRPLSRIIQAACEDARLLADAGFDALIVENFGDAPFRAATVDPHTVAAMTMVVRAVMAAVSLPVGVNVLRNDALAAVAIATVCGAAFVRVNVHTGVYAADQGLIEGRADDTLRYRRRLAGGAGTDPIAPMPAVFADVHVKHAMPLAAQPIAQAAAETAYRGRADGLIVSGVATGKPTDPTDLAAVRAAVPDRPIYVGSGATPETVAELLVAADGVIVGTAIKQGGVTTAPVDSARAAALVKAARR
ncbi:MAG: BtpA/SgcQ family protein [Planctomycetes bacterium]|nr:BtpA/SgcQ family protein [Planctomycetota bacterium]